MYLPVTTTDSMRGPLFLFELEFVEFVNFLAAQESIPMKRSRQAGNRFLGSLKDFTNSGSGSLVFSSIVDSPRVFISRLFVRHFLLVVF